MEIDEGNEDMQLAKEIVEQEAIEAVKGAEDAIQLKKKNRLLRFQNAQKEANSKDKPNPVTAPKLSKQDKEIFDKLVPHFCPQDRHNFEYKIMSKLHDFFVSRKIDYWAIGGTLLGQVKYSGTIPWDHDIDIFSEELLTSTEDELILEISKIKGCEIRRWLWDKRRPGLQIHDTRGPKGIAIDIFYGIFDQDTIYSMGMNIEKFPSRGRQGIDRIHKPGIRIVNFGDVKICVPTVESTIEYLDWKFGENWEDEYVIFDFKEKTSISFPANHKIDEKLRSFVINRSLK